MFAGWSIRDHGAVSTTSFDRLVWADRNVLKIEQPSNDNGRVLVTFPGLASFEINLTQRSIGVCRLAQMSEPTLHHLLADQVLPRLVSHEGNLVVHAAGVSSASGAILLVGSSGRGKSTLAASFHVSGIPLLGDDAFMIEAEGEVAYCRPLYRSLRLFRDSIGAVFETSQTEIPVADYSDKRNIIDLEASDCLGGRTKVRSIYCLGDPGGRAISVSPMTAAEACMALVEQSFALDPGDRVRSRRRMEQAAALVGAVPVFNLRYPRDFALLPDLRRTILSGVAQGA